MRISFGELYIGEIARNNLQKCMDTNWVSQGPMVSQFEQEWSNKFQYQHSVAMSTGTDACINACCTLYDFGAVRGYSEIICPALTFIATANAILAAGFIPKFVDVERHTLNINPRLIEDAITDRTVAIMCTHTMGRTCELDTISDIAARHNLLLIGDSCEAHCAKYKGKYIGHWEDIVTFSYYAAHVVVAGEGGMASTNRVDLANIMRSTRTHGREPGNDYFNFLRFGLNSRMTDLAAAIALEGMQQIDHTVSCRVKNRDYLLYLLSDLEEVFIMKELLDVDAGSFVSPHAFGVIFREDNESRYHRFYKYLQNNSIQCKTLFSSVPTQHPAFNWAGYKLGDGQFTEAEFVGRNGLHWGIHQALNESDMEYISDVVHRFVKEDAI